MKRKIKNFLVKIYSPFLVLALWEISSRYGILNPIFFPPPSLIFTDIYGLFSQGALLADITISMYRILGGLLMGGIPALILGILMGRSKSFYYFFHPLAALTYPIPKVAIIPLIILILGIGELSKLTVVAIGAFFLILLNTHHGVSNINKIYFDIAKIYDYSEVDKWRYIILPGAMPSIFNGIKLASGMCFILVVAAEFIASASGIGYRIWISWETFQITHMFSALFVISFLGWFLNTVLEKIEKKIMPWKNTK